MASPFGTRLRVALASVGLNIVQPLSQVQIDEAGIALRLTDLLPSAAILVLVGDGGRAFFEQFSARMPVPGADPLDHYTRGIVSAAVESVVAGSATGTRIVFPFERDLTVPQIPLVSLGMAAGLGRPGPLGLQVHPVFGPWWAYRAAVLCTAVWEEVPLSGAGCAGCAAPCISACPAQAVTQHGFQPSRCGAERLANPACARSCEARARCVRGTAHGHGDAQRAFHMAASLVQLRRGLAGPESCWEEKLA